MTKKHFTQVATILGRYKNDIPENIFNAMETNFADMFTAENERFDDDRFMAHIDKISKEWSE